MILSNGKSLQILQRGIAGSEIVERDVNPERAKLVQRRQRRVVVRDQNGFGDLELQPARVEPGLGEDGRDLERQRFRTELDRRDVDGDADIGRPGRGFGAGGAQYPLPDLLDQAGFLGDRHEVGRRDHAAHRMPPAQQRLAAGDTVAAADRPAAGSAVRTRLPPAPCANPPPARGDDWPAAPSRDRRSDRSCGRRPSPRTSPDRRSSEGRTGPSRRAGRSQCRCWRRWKTGGRGSRTAFAAPDRSARPAPERPRRSSMPCCRMANSSPPRRAMKSSGPTDWRSRSATPFRNSSPIRCPSVSLMRLNSSMSI